MSAEYPVVGNKVQVGPDLIPLSVIESWPKPNYVDPPTHFPTVIIWAAVFGSIAMVASCARIWSRFRLQRNAGLDDWLYLASLPFAASLVALSIMCNTRYYDKHIWDLPPKDAKPSANVCWSIFFSAFHELTLPDRLVAANGISPCHWFYQAGQDAASLLTRLALTRLRSPFLSSIFESQQGRSRDRSV